MGWRFHTLDLWISSHDAVKKKNSCQKSFYLQYKTKRTKVLLGVVSAAHNFLPGGGEIIFSGQWRGGGGMPLWPCSWPSGFHLTTCCCLGIAGCAERNRTFFLPLTPFGHRLDGPRSMRDLSPPRIREGRKSSPQIESTTQQASSSYISPNCMPRQILP